MSSLRDCPVRPQSTLPAPLSSRSSCLFSSSSDDAQRPFEKRISDELWPQPTAMDHWGRRQQSPIRSMLQATLVHCPDHLRCGPTHHRSREVWTMMTRTKPCPRLASGDRSGIFPCPVWITGVTSLLVDSLVVHLLICFRSRIRHCGHDK